MLISIGLQACGFHWRGKESSTISCPPIAVFSAQPYSPFSKALMHELAHHGITTQKNGLKLTILSEHSTYTTQSLPYDLNARIYTLTDTVRFQFSDQPEQLSSQRPLIIPQNHALYTDTQRPIIQEAVQAQLIQQLIDRLMAFCQKAPMPHGSVTKHMPTQPLD